MSIDNNHLLQYATFPEGAIKNGQSRETSNIGHTIHKTKTNKTKNTTLHVLDTTMRKLNTKLNTIRHYPSYKQLEVKTNPTCPFLIAPSVFRDAYFLVPNPGYLHDRKSRSTNLLFHDRNSY
jgi:hypothetical protein